MRVSDFFSKTVYVLPWQFDAMKREGAKEAATVESTCRAGCIEPPGVFERYDFVVVTGIKEAKP